MHWGKNDMIERRLMNSCIEVHETVRQIKCLVDVFNHAKSDLDWMSRIVTRELNTFELAERRRHSVVYSLMWIAMLNVI